MRTAITLLLLASIGLLVSSGAYAGPNVTARISVHAVSGSKDPPCSKELRPPCNDMEDHLTIRAAAEEEYVVYILVQEGHGFSGASFGITYDPTIEIRGWTRCADGSESPEDDWPASGSRDTVTWAACQDTPAAGDHTDGVTSVVGVLRAYANGPGLLGITPPMTVDGCGGETYTLSPGLAGGAVSFGDSTRGYDPCRGPYAPYSDFQGLDSQQLETVQIRFTSLIRESSTFILSGPAAVQDPSLFLAFARVEVGHIFFWEDPERIELSMQETSDLLDSLATVDGFVKGGSDSPMLLSVSVLGTFDIPTKAFETIMGPSVGTEVLTKIRPVLLGNWDALRRVDQLACRLQMLPDEGPEDVTSDVAIAIRPVRIESGDRYHFGISIKNRSDHVIAAPVTLGLRHTGAGGFVVPQPYANRCRGPRTEHYALFDLDVGEFLEPGETVSSTFVVINSLPEMLKWNPIVLAGPGVR